MAVALGSAAFPPSVVFGRCSDAAVMTGVDAGRMMRYGSERSGQLLLRAWVEGESAHGLRVRIICIYPLGEPSASVAATVETTCAIVRNWLNELIKAGSVAEPPPA
jgi:hypothetical protein